MINNIGEKGIITLPTLFMMNKPEINLESVIKRYAIFFDELYYFDNPLEGFFYGSFNRNIHAKNTLQNLLINKGGNEDFILSRQFNEIVRDERDMSEYFKENRTDYRQDSFMTKENKAAFLQHIKGVIKIGNPNTADMQLGFYMHCLFADFDLYSNLSENNPEYSGLISPLLKDVIFSVFNANKNTGEELINEISKIEMVDFGALNWKEIYELRKSGFAKDFRIKIKEWLLEFENDRDVELINSKIKAYIDDSKLDLRLRNRPDASRTIFTAILSKISFSFSLLLKGKQINDQIKQKKDFGWLHFIDDARVKLKK